MMASNASMPYPPGTPSSSSGYMMWPLPLIKGVLSYLHLISPGQFAEDAGGVSHDLLELLQTE